MSTPSSFTQRIKSYVERRRLPVEQIATLANISRKTMYRWVNGEVQRPRHWSQVVALGQALQLSRTELDELLWTTRFPRLDELKDLARYEYEHELIESFDAPQIQHATWPRPQVRIEPWSQLEAPAGAVQPDSPFYIQRTADSQLRQQLTGQGTTTTIQAGRQTGKTSLLMQAIQASREQLLQVIYLDFQLLDHAAKDDFAGLLTSLSESIIEQLDLEFGLLDTYWQTPRNPAQTFTRFIQREVLSRSQTPVLLAIDEADLLLDMDYIKHFFAMLRAWDSRRAFDAEWRKLNLVMVISTHPYLLIDDVNLSPFNVGLTIHLQDFSQDQIVELITRHGGPLEADQVPAIRALVGGHPYLVRQALYSLAAEGMTLPELEAISVSNTGPFGNHLNFYLHSLKKAPQLAAAFRQLLAKQSLPEETLLERLAAVGLIHRSGAEWTARCSLYQRYFSESLL